MEGYPYDITPADDGGEDIVIHLRPDQAAALNSEELNILANGFHSVFEALAMLRTGKTTDSRAKGGMRYVEAEDWYWVVNAIYKKLIGRLEGVGDAAVRAHAAAGGSVGHLANAMDVARSTAQHRREVILASRRSGWEAWATRPLASGNSTSDGGQDAAPQDDDEGPQD